MKFQILPTFSYANVFSYYHLNDVRELFINLLAAIEKENIKKTRSILYSFDVTRIIELRKKLAEGTERKYLQCTCNNGIKNMAFSSSVKNLVKYNSSSEELQQTSFLNDVAKSSSTESCNLQVCNLHRIIAELDRIIEVSKSRSYDATRVVLEHITAGRFIHAYYVMLTGVDKVDIEQLKSIANTDMSKLKSIQLQYSQISENYKNLYSK